MVSSRDAPERALRKRIYTLRHSSTPPMGWRSMVKVLGEGADGGPKVIVAVSSVRYKCHAYEKDLEAQVKTNAQQAAIAALETKSALPIPVGDLGSADLEADLILGKLKAELDAQLGNEFDNGMVVAGLASTMFKYIQRKDNREKGAGGALAMKEVIQAVIVCIQEEDPAFQERFVTRLYNRLGDDIKRYIQAQDIGGTTP